MDTALYIDIENHQWPILYRDEYNVKFWGLEKLHPFDAHKWGHIFKYLVEAHLITEDSVVKPNEAVKKDLLVTHTKQYLNSLNCSCNVAKIAEVPPLFIVPNFLVQRCYLKPMRYQTGGSILAGKLALERGWAINIGGGFHHCSANKGGGFCAYADITLLVHFLFIHYPQAVERVLIVDLDAHQGNGHERDFKDDPKVYILDVYNRSIYPRDKAAKLGINHKVELNPHAEDKEYLSKVERHLKRALDDFRPHIVVYNAGTDILKGDRLGCLSISSNGIITRDELVFSQCRSRHIPVVMLTSGGYLKQTARIIASSILNLHAKGLIEEPKQQY